MTGAVMQPRCVFCAREQYAPAVWRISHGEAGCAWCGRVPQVFTSEQGYRDALDAARRREARQ